MNKTLISLALGFALALVLSAPVQAADPAKLTFKGAFPTRAKDQIALSIVLTDAAGKPLGDREVAFYQRVDFFGQRDAYIATGTTGADGEATIAYEPAQTGRQSILAHFGGDKSYSEATVTGTIDVKDAAQLFEVAPLPLAAVSRWLPLVFGAFVLATWVALLGIFLSATVGIKSAAIAAVGHPSSARAQAASAKSRG